MTHNLHYSNGLLGYPIPTLSPFYSTQTSRLQRQILQRYQALSLLGKRNSNEYEDFCGLEEVIKQEITQKKSSQSLKSSQSQEAYVFGSYDILSNSQKFVEKSLLFSPGQEKIESMKELSLPNFSMKEDNLMIPGLKFEEDENENEKFQANRNFKVRAKILNGKIISYKDKINEKKASLLVSNQPALVEFTKQYPGWHLKDIFDFLQSGKPIEEFISTRNTRVRKPRKKAAKAPI